MIVAIVVTFHPEISHLSDLLAGLKAQVDKVVVVDNGSNDATQQYFNIVETLGSIPHVNFIRFETNLGIATAQNKGIDWAKNQKANYIILFDQDSNPAPDMVDTLVKATEKMQAEGYKVASVGPRFVDDRRLDNPPPFMRVSTLSLRRCKCESPDSIVAVDYLSLRRCKCESPDSIVAVDYLIASGCLIPLESLNVVGSMLDNLFIDLVDIEWGLRAKGKGYQSFGVCAAKMIHTLGGAPISLFGKDFASHSPLRHYYQFRNTIWLCRQSWLPFNWKFVSGKSLILKFILYSMFERPRLAHFKMMLKGIWHGLLGKMGKFKGDSRV